MPRLAKYPTTIPARVAGLCLLAALCLQPPAASSEYVVEVPVLAAIRTNENGVFEVMLLVWDQKPQPDPVELLRFNGRVRLGAGNLESIDRAFAYAIERTPNVRHSGTVSVLAHAYRPAASDGPSAGAAIAVGFVAMFKGERLQRGIAVTGTFEPGGRIGPVGGIPDKMRAAAREGYRTILVPRGQLYGPRWNLNQLALELGVTVKEVDTVDEAYELMTRRSL